MPSFLTDEDFAEIRSAIQDVTDTFLRLPITFKKLTGHLSRFSGDRKKTKTTSDIVVNGLIVWGGGGSSDGQFEIDETGKRDLDEGYILFNFDDMETAGLTDNENVIVMEGDTIIARDINYKITGVEPLGQLKDKDCVVKIYIKKLTQDG